MGNINERIEEMYCIRCHASLPVGDYPCGCPHCREKGHYASVAFRYRKGGAIKKDKRGMMRYGDFLPFNEFLSLGEGGTPVVPVPRLAKELGIGRLYLKNEFQNPTGSHKDRTSPFVIERAKMQGIETVTAASSGNEGVSLAIYSAYGGLGCDIVVLGEVAPVWENAILAAGANLVRTESPKTRFELMSRKVEEGSWYSATNYLLHPVGSSSYGIQGYKTIAYEIYEEFGGTSLPELILIPVARGDLLWGIYEGFREMKEEGWIEAIPRLFVVEPLPRIERVLAGEDYRGEFTGPDEKTPSVGGWTVTFQSWLAVRESGGGAVHVSEEEVEEDIEKMARQGFYLEDSSALIAGALRKLAEQGTIGKGSFVLAVATSHGFKNER